MDKKYGYNYQENGNCGQYALLNALLVLGIPISVKDAHRTTKVTRLKALWKGTEPEKIILGIKKYGCKAKPYTLTKEKEFKAKVESLLEQRIPIIACVDDYEHYVVLAGIQENKYFWIDSAHADIIGCSAWSDIESWMNCNGEYYFIAVIGPKFCKPVLEINQLLKLSRKNSTLFNNYGYMLRDLLDIINEPKTPGKRISAEEFLETVVKTVVDSIVLLYYYANRKKLERKLQDYISIAHLHRFTVLIDEEGAILARLTTVMTMTALGIE
ncbi:MAG: hypothetical protein HYV28_18225 [Ignavibacteriales bacterium]|nr:hypothetical protein [Ignavibacteriales bacterium]